MPNVWKSGSTRWSSVTLNDCTVRIVKAKLACSKNDEIEAWALVGNFNTKTTAHVWKINKKQNSSESVLEFIKNTQFWFLEQRESIEWKLWPIFRTFDGHSRPRYLRLVQTACWVVVSLLFLFSSYSFLGVTAPPTPKCACFVLYLKIINI